MHISCDLDGVIVDHKRNQQRLLAKRGFMMPRAAITKELIRSLLNRETHREFKRELYGAMSLRAGEIRGAKRALEALREKGHQLCIISRRAQDAPFALRWLDDRGFHEIIPATNVYFVDADEKKEAVCRKLGVELHIDDSPEVLEKLKTPVHKVLFGYKNSLHPSATFVASDWYTALAYIKTLPRTA